MVSKKVSDSVSEIFGIEKSLGFGIKKNYQKNLGFIGWKHGFLKFGISIGIGFETLPFFDSIRFGIKIGIQKYWIWYKHFFIKKYWIQYKEKLVFGKVL